MPVKFEPVCIKGNSCDDFIWWESELSLNMPAKHMETCLGFLLQCLLIAFLVKLCDAAIVIHCFPRLSVLLLVISLKSQMVKSLSVSCSMPRRIQDMQ